MIALNAVFVYYCRNMKRDIASGVDLVFATAFLIGYWYSPGSGFAIGMLMRFMNYAIPYEYSSVMIITIPLSGMIGLFGTVVSLLNINILIGAVITLIIYQILSFGIRIYGLGDNNYVLILMESAGLFLTNYIIFAYFF